MGCPVTEAKRLLGFIRSTLGMLKLGGVLLYACVELLVKRPSTRLDQAVWLHRLCRRAIRIFGVEVRTLGHFPERGVLIANHLSYLDIVVLASLSPCVFVSKSEIEAWPVLGWMTTRSGTVYVDRGRRSSAKQAGSGMQAVTEAGLPVVLFPEGTTSNGDTILKFHSGLLATAAAAEQPVTAAYLRYSLTGANGDSTASDDVAFWGEHPMTSHVFRFLALRDVRAEVIIAEAPIRFSTGITSRKLFAVEARHAVCLLRTQSIAIEGQIEAPIESLPLQQ